MNSYSDALRSRQRMRRHNGHLRAVEPLPPREPQGPLKLRTSYNFVDKSPVVGELQALIGSTPYKKIAAMTTLHPTTIGKLFSGKTKDPRAGTIERFARAYGKRIGLVDA